MINIYKEFQTDIEKEEEGIWYEIDKDSAIRFKPFGNKEHLKRLDDLRRPHRALYRKKKTTGSEKEQFQKIDNEIHLKAITTDVLLDWKGVKDNKGKNIKYTPEKALSIFLDPSMKEFADFIVEIVTNKDHFKKYDEEDIEEDSKQNLKK